MTRGLAWYLALYYHCKNQGIELDMEFDLTLERNKYKIKSLKNESKKTVPKRKRTKSKKSGG